VRWLVAVAFALAVTAGDAAAAPRVGHIAFRGFDADDGLTALDVVVGLQDREGYIWAASPSGLFRHDGARFRRYSTDDGLPSLLVTDMAVAPDGTLWGATARGLFYQHGERFVAVGVGTLPGDGMHLLGFDPEGRTWVTTTSGPYLATTVGVVPVAGWPGGEAFGLVIDPDGTMLVGRGSRLLRRGRDGGDFVDLGHEFGGMITAIVRDGRGRLWVRAGARLWMQPSADAPYQDRSQLAGAVVGPHNVRLAVGATGNLLVPTASGVVEIDGDEPRLLATDLPAEARDVKSVWVDREGSMWLTSLGLHHELGRGLWRTVSVADGLPANVVWSIHGLVDGRVAVGTDRGLALIGADGIAAVAGGMVMDTVEAPAGVLWIVDSALARLDLASGERRTIGPADGWHEGAPTSLAVDHAGTLWVGVDRGGLYRAAPAASGRFERVPLPGADGARVWSMATDGDRLWVTTSAGLYLRSSDTWRRFTRADGLLDDVVTFIVVRRDREVCISYLAPVGVSCLRAGPRGISDVRQLDERDGLSGPMPYFFAEDHDGRLWIGGALGIAVLGEDGADRFTRRGGAPGDDCNANASWVAPDGRVWVGTSTGLGVFDTPRYQPPPPPTVVFQNGHLGREPVDHDGFARDEDRTVRYGDGHLDLELAVLSYLDPHLLEYEVRMFGFDDEWRTSDVGEIRYHRLPAGSYQFAARARYRGGPWGSPTTFAFVVATPWWQTWQFRALVVAAVIALGVIVGIALTRWRSRALVARNLELEATVRARTAELIEANAKVTQAEKLSALGRLLAQLSHEINNPLNVIHNNLGPLEEYQRALAEAAEATRTLADEPGLRARIDELWQRLDLRYVIDDGVPAFEATREAAERIARINGELKTFLRGEPPPRELVDLSVSFRATVAMFKRGYPDLDVRCDLGPLPRVLATTSRLDQTLINLLHNAADAMGSRGRITVSGDGDDRHVWIRVTDSGPGVRPEVRSRIFEPFFTTKRVGHGLGLGLAICREIVVAHGGTLELDERVTSGACFVITLPVAVALRRAA
jgi:signal transduction histidine kinase/ligand-binding sensor domain-containing protein